MGYITCHICYEVGGDNPADSGSLICRACFLRTMLILNEIRDLYEWISDPEYLANTREPASGFTKSRPPLSLHAVSILDPRTKMRRKGDPISPRRVLWAWWMAVQEAQGWDTPSGPYDVGTLTHVLQGKMGWVSQQPAVVRFARHMAAVVDCMRKEVGDTTKEETDD